MKFSKVSYLLPPKWRLVGAVVAMWIVLFFIGSILSTETWVLFVSFIVGFAISDFIYDWVMKKRDPRTLTDTFLNYLIAVVGGSLVADFGSERLVLALQFLYSLLPFLPYHYRVALVVALGTTPVLALALLVSWRLQSTEQRLRKRPPPR